MKKLSLLLPLVLLLTSCGYTPIPHEYLSEGTMELLQKRASTDIVNSQNVALNERYGLALRPERYRTQTDVEQRNQTIYGDALPGSRQHTFIAEYLNPRPHTEEGKVYEVNIDLISERYVNQEEARKIHVEVVEFILSTFNSDNRYRQYMKTYPFTEENVRVEICYPLKLSNDTLISCTNNQGGDGTNISFYRKEDSSRTGPFSREKYQDAKQNVKEKNDKSYLFVYTLTPFIILADIASEMMDFIIDVDLP